MIIVLVKKHPLLWYVKYNGTVLIKAHCYLKHYAVHHARQDSIFFLHLD